MRATGDGGFRTEPVAWDALVKRRAPDDEWTRDHADLAASVQVRLEEVLLELVRWLHAQTGDRVLTMAGGVALNCVANSRLAARGPVRRGLGAAGRRRRGHRARRRPARGGGRRGAGGADAGRRARPRLDRRRARRLAGHRALPYERPADLADEVAQALAADGVVAWFAGRREYGPRALGHRSLLANPGRRETLTRLNDVKGREQFRPVAPMVRLDRAGEVFDGPLPSPYMLFVHRVRREWGDRIPAVVHVDGTARIQTVDPADRAGGRRAAGRVRAADRAARAWSTPASTPPAGRWSTTRGTRWSCFGSAPVDVLVLGPFLLAAGRRRETAGDGAVLTRWWCRPVGRPSLRRCWPRSAAGRGPAPARSSWSTTARRRPSPPVAATWPGWPPLRWSRAAPRAGRGAQRRLARHADAVGGLPRRRRAGRRRTGRRGWPRTCGAAGATSAGSQGRLRVPLPADRRPTDWERGTAGLADAAG